MAARPHFTQSSLHLQLAGRVLVRHPCGYAGATAPGAGTPFGALLYAGGGRWGQSSMGVIAWQRGPQPVWSHCWRETEEKCL